VDTGRVSEENIEVVSRLLDAWSAHDRERMAEYLHPDAVFHSAITNVVGETIKGREQIVAVFDRWEEEWSSIYWEIDELIPAGDHHVVSLHRVIATGRASGIVSVRDLAGLLEVRDGLVVKQWIYLDRNEALEAAGLPTRDFP
jgi:ketosteroid isomerase-like protein